MLRCKVYYFYHSYKYDYDDEELVCKKEFRRDWAFQGQKCQQHYLDNLCFPWHHFEAQTNPAVLCMGKHIGTAGGGPGWGGTCPVPKSLVLLNLSLLFLDGLMWPFWWSHSFKSIRNWFLETYSPWVSNHVGIVVKRPFMFSGDKKWASFHCWGEEHVVVKCMDSGPGCLLPWESQLDHFLCDLATSFILFALCFPCL